MDNQFTHGSLFTGVGVFDLAAKQHGFKNVFGCDIDLYAREHFKHHYPDSQLYGNIENLESIPYVDFLSFGFPCQNASIASPVKFSNPLSQPKTGLFYHAVRLIRQSRPRFFIAENVYELRNRGLYTVLQELTQSGYHVGYTSLAASRFGALHRRRRLFIVGYDNRLRWNPMFRIFCGITTESTKTLTMERQFHGAILETFWAETDRTRYGNLDETTKRLLDGLCVKAAGNAIYYPIAEMFTRKIKDELLLIS